MATLAGLVGVDDTGAITGAAADAVTRAAGALPLREAPLTAQFKVTENAPDIRSDLQAALDGARNGSDRSYWSFLEVTAGVVELRPGTYRVNSKSDGMPSIVVPRGVELRADKANLVAEYPKTPTTNWAAILLHSRAGLTVGTLKPTGTPPDAAHVYDGIRAYMQDNWNAVSGVGGRGVVTGFQGAGYRALGSYVIRLKNLLFEFCSHGVVHGHSGGLVADGTGAYVLPTGQTVNTATRRPTDLFLNSVYFNSTRGNNVVIGSPGTVAAPNTVVSGTDSVTGGNTYLRDVLFEDSPARAIRARELSQITFNNVHLEEIGAPSGPMLDIDVVYGNIGVNGMRINTSQKRASRDLTGATAYATANRIWQLGSFGWFDHAGLYFQNSGSDIAFSGAESWAGAWTNSKYDIRGIQPDVANTGKLLAGPLLPYDNFRDRVTNTVLTQR